MSKCRCGTERQKWMERGRFYFCFHCRHYYDFIGGRWFYRTAKTLGKLQKSQPKETP